MAGMYIARGTALDSVTQLNRVATNNVYKTCHAAGPTC